MEYMAAHGVVCVTGDHRGHGASIKSTDDLGYMYDGGYYALVEDMRMITDWIHNEYPGTPVYLLGHSMGSMAARVYVKQDDSGLSGLIICGSPSWNPLSRVGRAFTGLLCHLGLGRSRPQLLQKITSGTFNKRFASEGPEAWTCSDPKMRKLFKENPLCNFRFTMNGVHNLLKMMEETYDTKGWKVTQPSMPIRFISGTDDPCMITEQKFHKAVWALHSVGYENISSSLYPDMRHEVLNEINKVEVWNEILNFMQRP
jgi:alpha-beta hydrolase superfamily lysophospholipase